MEKKKDTTDNEQKVRASKTDFHFHYDVNEAIKSLPWY